MLFSNSILGRWHINFSPKSLSQMEFQRLLFQNLVFNQRDESFWTQISPIFFSFSVMIIYSIINSRSSIVSIISFLISWKSWKNFNISRKFGKNLSQCIRTNNSHRVHYQRSVKWNNYKQTIQYIQFQIKCNIPTCFIVQIKLFHK